MKIEVKSSIILIATLLLGVVLGGLGQGALRQSRSFQDAPPPPPRFVEHMEEVLQLRADQRARVMPILEATGAANRRVIDAARQELRSRVDSMSKAVEPYLDDPQRARLAQRVREMPNPFRRRPPRDGRGLPPEGSGPPPDGSRPPPDGAGPPP
jgi:hypothetical protein